jgi:hypothetical protein
MPSWDRKSFRQQWMRITGYMGKLMQKVMKKQEFFP